MEILLTTVSLALAAVFAAAGLAKLADREGSRAAARAFGVPDRLAAPVAHVLPPAELAIALLFLPAATRLWAAVAAVALLAAFCAAIGRALARGERPSCHCFGQLHSAPAGWRTLARNAVLAGAAALVAVAGRDEPGPGAFAWTTRLDGTGWLVLALGVALAAVVTIGGYAVVHVLRSYGRMLVRLESVEGRLRAAGFDFGEPDDIPELGLAPGSPAPDFRLATVDGERLGLDDLLRPGNPLLLVFTSPGCGACSVLMPTVARWQREHAGELTIALLNEGDADLIRAEAREHGLAHVLVDAELAAYTAYEANGTPSAVLVSADGTIASWLAAGSEWIETLVDQALHGAGDASSLPIGAEAPEHRLEVLDGGEAALRELVDGPTVLLFWNPGCGFCRAMHDDVLAWEASRPASAPRLVVVSAGAVEDVRAEGFASPVLLDPDWALSAALGADGTPMALLLDGDGRVASRPASGGAAALELLGALAPAVAD